jgi:N-acetylornithine carbamoyltransferase
MNGFYHLGLLERDRVEALVARALELRAGAAPRRFPGRTLGLLFLNPSLRTRASFQVAAARLGLEPVVLSSGGAQGVWELELADGVVMDGAAVEHVREAAGVLGRYVDCLGVRAFPGGRDLALDRSDPALAGFRSFSGVPVVNMESALWHPCQALGDRVTLEALDVERQAKLVLTWAWHPKALPHAVPNSTVTMAAQRGMEVVVLRPEGYDLHPDVLAEAERLAAAAGGSVRVSADRAELAGASIVYAKSWASLETYGDAEAESRLRAGLRGWCVDERRMAAAGPQARFMHCLPVRRNVVVTDAVLDGPTSVVLDQAENRLYAQIAVLEQVYSELAEPSPRAVKALQEALR